MEDEFTSIFTNNENIKNIISSEGLEIVSNMEWWKYIIFYEGVVITLSWLYLIYHGYKKDKSEITLINLDKVTP